MHGRELELAFTERTSYETECFTTNPYGVSLTFLMLTLRY